MSRAAQRSDEGRRSHRWMALFFLLLPGAVALGLVLPELVEVAPAEEAPEVPGPPVFHPPPLYKPPLLVPRDFSSGFTPALLDLGQLFSRSAVAPAPRDSQLWRMLAFPQNTGELIALDEVSEQLKDLSFKDVLAAAVLPRTPLPGVSPFQPLMDPIPRSNGLRYDDFPGPASAEGPVAPVPEPGTALLLGLGLCGMAALERRRRG